MTLYIVILMGSIALGLVFMLSQSSFRSIKSANENKIFNNLQLLVDSCAEVALENIREINGYSGSGNVMINDNTCTFSVSNDGGENRTVNVSGSINNFTKNLVIIIDGLNPIHIFSWQDV